MNRAQKTYARIKEAPGNVRFEEIESLLIEYCGCRERTGTGSHRVFIFPNGDVINIPYRRPTVKAIYIKKAIKHIQENNLELFEDHK